MSTKMTECAWGLALEVFRACPPRRGAKGRDDPGPSAASFGLGGAIRRGPSVRGRLAGLDQRQFSKREGEGSM